MKKKIIIIVACLLGILAITAMLIPKKVYQKWFNKEEPTQSEYNILVYVKNSKNQIVGINVPVSNLEEDQIRQKWNIMTTNNNLIPSGYESVVSSDIELTDYLIEDNILKLQVSNNIVEENRQSLEALVWTFVDNNIEELEIYTDEQLVTEVSDYKISKLNKEMGINYTYETLYLYESTATTIVFQEDDYILPVTYFHLNDDVCDYIVMKILDNVDGNEYDYTLTDSVLTIDFVDASILTTNQIASISESVALNFELSSLNINNNENVFYQRVFEELNETV